MFFFVFLALLLLSLNSYALDCTGSNPVTVCYSTDKVNWTSIDYDVFPHICDPLTHFDLSVSPDGEILFPSANAGAQVTFSYVPFSGGVGTAPVNCSFVPGVPSDAKYQKMERGASFSFLTKEFYDIEDGWINVNDKVRMKVTSNRCAGACSGNAPIDLADMMSTEVRSFAPGVWLLPSEGSSHYLWGTVTLELRKDVYDGDLGLDGLELYSVGYGYDYDMAIDDVMPSRADASYTVILTDTEVVIPNNCVINDDSDFNIDFGLVQNNKIDTKGLNYHKPLSVKYNCKSPITTDVIVRFIGATSSSSSDYFSTSNSNIDIKIQDSGGSLVKPNSEIVSKLVSGEGADDFTVSLVASSSDVSIATGEFEASLIVDMSIP